MGKNPFDDDFKPEIETKESSYSNVGRDTSHFPHEKYKTIRIRPEDYKELKVWAFNNEMTMVDAVSLAIKKLTQ